MLIGISTNIMPTVMMINWIMSVSVSDHMPPNVEYSTTKPPPSKIDVINDRSNITCITLPMAMIDVTATIRS
ncbi:hypothetical protein D3C80_1357730 [compost metagenome]